VPRDAFVLKIQRELCYLKYVRKVSGLSRNGPLNRREADQSATYKPSRGVELGTWNLEQIELVVRAELELGILGHADK